MAYCRWLLGRSSLVWPPRGQPPGISDFSASRKKGATFLAPSPNMDLVMACEIAPEPAIALDLVVGDEQALGFGRPHQAGHGDGVVQLALRPRRRLSERVGHEAAVDQHHFAVRRLERRDHVPAGRPVRHGEEIALLGVVEAAFGADAEIA